MPFEAILSALGVRPKNRRRSRAAIIAGLMVLLGSIVGAGSASADGDRPSPVRPITEKYVAIHPDVRVTGAAKVSCDPGWSGGELSVRVSQCESYTDGFVVASVRCDGKWHRVPFTLFGPPCGKLRPGAVSFSSQFLVTNDDSGDSAGGHDQRAGLLVRRL